ncbi:MAG TPA: hypothetical protein VKV04_03915 [Verrucomicrobiae bacterium]|nr:hypothetical protein [Verrucomicrobiae bacterium]
MKDSPLKRLVVRKVGTKKFLSGKGRWTKREEAALSFTSLVDAIHNCLARGLKEVEFVLRFENSAMDQCYALSLA